MTTPSKQQVAALIRDVIKKELKVEVAEGHWTSPNTRTLKVFLGTELIQSVDFDISQKPEYEG